MGFSLPQLNSSCCGCTLRTGTLIILWLYTIGAILLLGGSFVTVVVPVQPSSNSTTPAPIPVTTTPAPASEKIEVTFGPRGVVGQVLNVINLISGIVGLFAVYKEIHLYLLPFLIWEAVYNVVQIIVGIVQAPTASNIIGEFIGFLILFYFWLVVYSHYRVLKGTARPIQA